jgi:hypothetical protein
VYSSDVFEGLQYKCAICLGDDFNLDEMVSLSCQPIGHKYCSDCFVGYCSSKINDGTVTDSDLVCPAPGCGEPVTIHELEAHLSSEQITRYHRLLLKSLAGDKVRNPAIMSVQMYFRFYIFVLRLPPLSPVAPKTYQIC